MSQYKTGTATVTNGSATVTGTNTLWLANVTAGDSFTVAGDGVMYDVASVDSDTQITLSVAYAGVTASGVVYAIGTGFTVPDSFPEMSQGDIETATIFTRAMRKIQSKFTGIAINTTAEIGQAVSDHVALADPHSQYADQANTYTETEVDELTGSLAYPNTTLASSSDIPESVEPAIAAYPHIQGFRTGTGTALTFAQAVEEAAERGARLLTIQELEAGVVDSAGFTYDFEITWTSSPAGVGLVYGNIGQGHGTRVVLNTNTDTAAGGYAVSVIGQRQWTDTQYADNATTYTETEVDGLLNTKADQANTYTETEVDNLLDDKADKATTYTETEVDGLLNTKADQATTYTETEVDELTGSLAYPNTTLASSSDISEDVQPAIAEYPHIQGFRTGTGTALTFAQVVEEAAERGARLLTIQELEAGVADGTGFQYDPEITWTSSPAGVGLVYGNRGDGNGTRVVLNTSTDTAAGGYAVSVIGQRQWTDTQYAGLDGGASANFTAMPQVGGDPIVESGSNADGEWTRWADGTQITHLISGTLTASDEVSSGSGLYSSVISTATFPRAFDVIPVSALGVRGTSGAGLSGVVGWASARDGTGAVNTTTAVEVGFTSPGQNATALVWVVSVGRWQ